MSNDKNYLVYCRVSSQRQVDEGDGLGSQKKRCVDWATSQGGKVEKTFQDKGVSGSVFDRPAIILLFKYLDDNPHKNYRVAIDDLSRLARDVAVHFRLRLELKARGATLECPNFNFEDTPEGEFIETILAGKSQLDRQQNRRQVVQKQKARLERGYWPFGMPIGLINIKDKFHGKLLVSREPYASIYKEAIESYEKDLLNTQEEVRQFIKEKYVENDIDKPISIHGVERILKSFLYAGYIEYKPWEVKRRDGHHKGFITKDTFKNVQDKLSGRSKPKLVKTYKADFPLRGFVTCDSCGSKLRASWNTGNGGKYPNYWCQNQECSYRYKVTKAWDIHAQFEEIISSTSVNSDMSNLAKKIFVDLWGEEKKKAESNIISIDKSVNTIDERIESLVERIESTSKSSLIEVYENQIDKLSQEKDKIQQSRIEPLFSQKEFGTCLEKVTKTLKNPLLLWNSDNLEDKRTILYMYFENGLSYDYESGFGTADFSPAINLLRDPSQMKSRDVEMAGSEPASVTEQ